MAISVCSKSHIHHRLDADVVAHDLFEVDISTHEGGDFSFVTKAAPFCGAVEKGLSGVCASYHCNIFCLDFPNIQCVESSC